MVTYTVMSLSTVRKTCVFQRIQAEKEESEGGELAKDEEEKAEAGEVEKERGVMPEEWSSFCCTRLPVSWQQVPHQLCLPG